MVVTVTGWLLKLNAESDDDRDIPDQDDFLLNQPKITNLIALKVIEQFHGFT